MKRDVEAEWALPAGHQMKCTKDFRTRYSNLLMGQPLCRKNHPPLVVDELAPEVRLTILAGFTAKCSRIQIQSKSNSPTLSLTAASGLKHLMQWRKYNVVL